MSDKKTTETKVQSVELELDDILGQPGAESVMTPGEEDTKKPSIFAPVAPDTSFLDKADEKKDPPPDPKPVDKADPPDPGTDPVDDPADDIQTGDDLFGAEDEKKKAGRPTGLVAVTKRLLEKKILMPFEEEKKIEDYTEEDFQELYEENFRQMQGKLEEEVPVRLFESMPPEMQQAYLYIANGGTDIKGMFRALATSAEIADIDVAKPAGQKQVIRTYLQTTRWGTPEEIEEEVNSLEDKGELEKKAKQFKPKLDAMQQEMVNEEISRQAQTKKQRQLQSQKYMESVYTTLEKGDLNGLKLDNRTQNLLYAGLTQSNYPSMSGKQTNMLGHLLEKYQWVEPNHGLIAEALWLLADPDGYRANITQNIEKGVTTKTMRTLKTEQSKKDATSLQEFEEEGAGTEKGRRTGIVRPKKNFFTR